MASDTDGLYDTSEPALSNRLDRFRRRVVESPLDRASFAAMLAVEDLNAAIHLAQSPEQLAEVRDAIEDTIKSLIISSSVALTLAEFWSERR